jgi:hypothetical protein
MSYAAEVIADSSGEWIGNRLRFATELEAQKYATDLEWRWSAVRKTRVTFSKDPVNAAWVENKLKLLPADREVAT